MIRPVLQFPHPVLRQKSQAITEEEQSSEEYKKLVADLVDTLEAAKGAAISAIQIGVPARVIVVSPVMHPDGPVLVNPRLVEESGNRVTGTEGCLSMFKISAPVARSFKCIVEGDGGVRLEAEGMLARALLHEIDHLDGVLMIDHVGPVKKEMIRRRMKGRAGNAVVYRG